MANKSKERGKSDSDQQRPAQSQDRQPGHQNEMVPEPVTLPDGYTGSGKLDGKVALITGGDSGIGRSVAVMFAREGADVAIVYLDENSDAAETKRLVESEGRRCLVFAGDIGDQTFCESVVANVAAELGRIDVLVNNAAEQHPEESLERIREQQLVRTFRTNIFSMFYMSQAALPFLKEQSGSSIINTTSVTAYRGSPGLLDYSATKGAIVSFTRSLSQNLVKDGIRVNAVAPGPIWTPLIPATFPPEKVAKFGSDAPMGRAGQPHECASCYVFLASDDSSYMTGQVLHPNGGEVING
ncbi:General stress protein 39 [Rubripirellula amarantea]|uniref:General stress protein 39 n=1 Tax=Rubripirellula amarantea TaxID=2527999 RepID=A0A5C5WT13_9BACT|nr:SDR family oxidoreductase [Rubripirellula amarantea]TWT53787.1 General stress protein 39 [Rubripirellula amarantea]